MIVLLALAALPWVVLAAVATVGCWIAILAFLRAPKVADEQAALEYRSHVVVRRVPYDWERSGA